MPYGCRDIAQPDLPAASATHKGRETAMKQSLKNISGWIGALLCAAFLTLPGSSFAASDDTLGPGDSIRVTVFDNPDLTTETRVSPRGSIRFPLLGDVKIGGLTPPAAVDHITALLKDGNIIRDPRVTLSVIQVRSRQVSVLGQVARPGRYALDETTTTITDMLALAGGISPTGDDVVTIIRNRDGKTEKMEIDIQKMVRSGDISTNVEIENGDTVFVRRAPVFYIYGEVQKAGPYRLENDMSIMQALSMGGGLTIRGTERGIKVHRRAEDGALKKQEAQLADLVKADDIIYIQESLF